MAPGQVADLHVHTTASDGTLTPEQVVREADTLGLAAVGIADHDTVDGVPPGLSAGKQADVVVVPAVEINTDYGNDEIHLLGYYIECESPSLAAHLQHLRLERLERNARIVDRLNELGLRISLDRVKEIAGTGSMGRPHIAKAIVEAGYASTMSAAFGKYLVRGAAAYVARHKLTPFEAMDIIHEAGGVAVLAHPGKTRHDELIPPLVDAGMQGIEAFHPDHKASQTQKYIELAHRHDLIITGGSDSHGPDMLKVVRIGKATVSITVVGALRELAALRKSRRADRA